MQGTEARPGVRELECRACSSFLLENALEIVSDVCRGTGVPSAFTHLVWPAIICDPSYTSPRVAFNDPIELGKAGHKQLPYVGWRGDGRDMNSQLLSAGKGEG